MPPIRRVTPSDPFDRLPAGFQATERPGVYARFGCVVLRHSHATHNPSLVGGGRALYEARIADLFTWARAAGFGLAEVHNFRPTVMIGREDVQIGPPIRLVDRWYVGTQADLETSGYSVANMSTETFPCPIPECNESHSASTLVCPVTLELIICPSCGRKGIVEPRIPVTDVIGVRNALRSFTCRVCGTECGVEGCTAVARHREYCEEHGTTAVCCNCMHTFSWRTEDDPRAVMMADGRWLCNGASCSDRLCTGCNRFSSGRLVFSARFNAAVCDGCRRNSLRHETESFDERADDDLDLLLTIPGRESIRDCGIEIEGANGTHGANDLALSLFRERLSTTDVMVDHGSGTRYGLVHVEYDSSVDWECVIGPINMANTEHVNTLNRVMKVIRQGIKAKRYKLDLRAGVHIHVGAERTSLAQAYNLSHIFTYLEDPLFRIGAAKWPFHRASQGSNYCAPIPKHSRKLDFYSNYGGTGRDRNNHYYALSFSNYFNSMMRNCVCGATQAGVWDECTCPELGKCTFEFRLFNTTANMKKMKAYLALSQAMVAKAITLPEIKDPHTALPGLPFNQRVFKEMSTDEQELLVQEWRPRLAYIFSELPLTDDEKEAVLYCVRHCEIAQGLSEDEILELANTTTTESEVTA